MFDLVELEEAEATMHRFLAALEAGDEVGMAALVYPPSLAVWGASPGKVRSRFLRLAGLDESELDRIGVVHTARILSGRAGPSGLVAFGMLARGPTPELILAPTPARALALTRDGGEWKVWGTPDPTEFADATLVPLPTSGPVHGEMLSVLAAEWVMALEPHLNALNMLDNPAEDAAATVSAIERAHSVASIAMLAFAIESLGARLAASGRLSENVPASIIASLPDDDWRQQLAELLVVRNVLTHNHVWRIAVRVDADWRAIAVEESEHIYGERERRTYRAAVDPGADRTNSLRLHVIPTSVRRTDVLRALSLAVRTFDHLATLDAENMRSLSDHSVRVAGRVRQLRDLATNLGQFR